jgi:hypothetical protein
MSHVVQNMGDIQVRRLPVVNRDKRLVGVISLADAVLKHHPEAVGVAMTGVVEPGAPNVAPDPEVHPLSFGGHNYVDRRSKPDSRRNP